MSRWLKSVNTLLDQLDGTVDTAIEQRVQVQDEVQVGDLDDILLKRGLGGLAAEEGDTESENKATSNNDEPETEHTEQETKQATVEQTATSVKSGPEVKGSGNETKPEAEKGHGDYPPEPQVTTVETNAIEEKGDSAGPKSTENTEKETEEEIDFVTEEIDEPKGAIGQTAAIIPGDENTAALQSQITSLQHQLDRARAEADVRLKKEVAKVKEESQKEVKTLKRHVLSLHTQLEGAEAELAAQRTELQRAAERMEKDRTRTKEEKEALLKSHTAELKKLKEQHEQNMTDQKKRLDDQIDEARTRLQEMEQKRMQEGGDWSKEMEEAVSREREVIRKMSALEDETATLVSQVSSLQTQLEACESRLASVTSAADGASERERQAEDRLDAALSLHARQLSQRQARESELERTVAELGAALVVARQRVTDRLGQGNSDPVHTSSVDQEPVKAKLDESREELETLRAQLSLERQRCETLQSELADMSKERTEEASEALVRQRQYDRKVTDLTATVSKLQSSLRDVQNNETATDSEMQHRKLRSAEIAELNLQIQALSDQLVRQQQKIDHSSSELLALRSRLRSANLRAEQAEKALTESGNSLDLFDAEQGYAGNGGRSASGSRIRRRGARTVDDGSGSIRSAISLNPGGGDKTKEQIGQAIDALDKWSVQTGFYLRRNPLARGGFLLYLITLHLWAFCLLVFHAHSLEKDPSGFGMGQMHGQQLFGVSDPHALCSKMEGMNISGAVKPIFGNVTKL